MPRLEIAKAKLKEYGEHVTEVLVDEGDVLRVSTCNNTYEFRFEGDKVVQILDDRDL